MARSRSDPRPVRKALDSEALRRQRARLRQALCAEPGRLRPKARKREWVRETHGLGMQSPHQSASGSHPT